MPALSLQEAFQLAHRYHGSGRLAEAEALYRQILAVEPRHAPTLHLLGVIALQMRRYDVAVDLITQAIELNPNHAEAHNNLGNAFKDMGRLDEAIAAFRRATGLKTNYATAYSNLGAVLKGNHQLDEAMVACRQAIALKPDFAEAHLNLGSILQTKGQLDEAIAAYRQAIAFQPHFPEALNNLGGCLQIQGQIDHAIAIYRQAIALHPDCAEAHLRLAFASLLQGKFAEGWAEYEWRWKVKNATSLGWDCAEPRWDGSPLSGRTILLHAEQGFGDTFQFIRYLPMVRELGGNVIIESQKELERLLLAEFPSLPIFTRGETLPPFDVHCPLPSLPRLFATDLSNIPANVPYLRAIDADSTAWQGRLACDESTIKVGLVWAGNPDYTNDRQRSLRLASLAPLFEIRGITWVSLQKSHAGREAGNPADGFRLIDFTEDLKDFADTAALIANLDLIIAVDTAVAHLAGAIGQPVWILLPFSPDWRWMLNRSDSPWYPTMRLFRQPQLGDWDSVVANVAAELRRYSSAAAGIE